MCRYGKTGPIYNKPAVAASILEGLDEMLAVNRLKLPAKLRRLFASTNSIENMMGTVRRVCRNVKRWLFQSELRRATLAMISPRLVQKPPPKLKLGFDRVIAITIMSATGAGLTIGDVHLHGGFARESADLAATN